MAIDPPYRLDPFRNIINVQWEEGTEQQTDRPGGCASRLWTNVAIGVSYLYVCYPFASIAGGNFYDNSWTLVEGMTPETEYLWRGTMSGGPLPPAGDEFNRLPYFEKFTIDPPSGLTISSRVYNESSGRTATYIVADFGALSFKNSYCGTYRPSGIDWGPIQDDWTLGGIMFYRGIIWFE